jgi:hypothetical protein
VGGVAGSDQTTSSAMTTAAAMMSNLFLSIGFPLFSCHQGYFRRFDGLFLGATNSGNLRGLSRSSSAAHP